MKFIFSTGSLYTYSIERCFDFAVRSGFDGIELLIDHRWDTRQSYYLHHLLDRYSLPIIAVHSPFFTVPGWPQDQPAMIQKSVKLAEEVGSKVVVHHLPARKGYAILMIGSSRFLVPIYGWDREKSYRQWLLHDYERFKSTTDVTLCIENLPAHRLLNWRRNFYHWNTVEEIVRFPSLTMDTTHLGTWGLEPAEVYAKWAGRVNHVHLSNFDGHEHRLPEKGHLHLDRLLAQMSADSYKGVISFELEPDALKAGSSDERIVELLTTSLEHCRTWALQTVEA